MSKEKLLASAQKNLERGQLAKAISDYQKVVEADPRDVRNRQKLAELFSRARQIEPAMTEYGAVAKYYSDNGFYLKAIAVYKQMQRLDPARPDLYQRLAELNQKQGLVGNAAAEYRNLVALYEGQKKFPEAVGALEKLKELEPENYNLRIKIIETFLRAGIHERARREFEEVLGLLREKEEFARALRLYEMLLPLHPNDAEMKAGYGEALVRHGDVGRGTQILSQLADQDRQNVRVLIALAEGYRRQGERDRERATLHRGLGAHPGNLDLGEALIRSLVEAGEFAPAVKELGAWYDSLVQGGRKESLQEFCRPLVQALPDDPQVRRFFSTGEGGRTSRGLRPGDPEAVCFEELIPPAPAEEDALEIDLLPALGVAEPEEPEIEGETRQRIPTGAAEAEAQESTLAELSFCNDGAAVPLDPPAEISAPEPQIAGRATADPDPSALTAAGADLELELEFDMEFEVSPASDPIVSPEAVAADASELIDLELTEEALEDVELIEDALEEAELAAEAPFVPEREPGILVPAVTVGETAEAGSDFIDLAAVLLEDEAEDEEIAPAVAPVPQVTMRKKGIRTEAVQLEDAESHFQLGIAYKEMGLLEEAEKEFRQAMQDKSRAAACLILQGICMAARGEREQAETAFKSGLRLPGLAEDEKLSLHFELGDLYEQWGRLLDSLDSFQYVADQDAFFRQVGERMVDLRRRLGLDGSGKPGTDSDPKGSRKRVSYV